MKNYTHDELVDKAAAWLRARKHYLVITEQTYVESPDAIGWHGPGMSVLIECKASRSDFLADYKKPFRQVPAQGMGATRYYLAPEGLIAPTELPVGWGLLKPSGRSCSVVTWPVPGAFSDYNRLAEIGLLAAAMRRLGPHYPKGVSCKFYTYQTNNRCTIGVEEIADPVEEGPLT